MSIRAKSCLCCGDSLLRHVRHGKVYWFCKSCWQEVPLYSVYRGSGRKTAESQC